MGYSGYMTLGDLVEIIDDWPPNRAGTLAIFIRNYEDASCCYILPLDTLEEEMYHLSDIRIVSAREQKRSPKDTK